MANCECHNQAGEIFHCPVIWDDPSIPGALPSDFLQQLPKLQQLRELCGHRQVIACNKKRGASVWRAFSEDLIKDDLSICIYRYVLR